MNGALALFPGLAAVAPGMGRELCRHAASRATFDQFASLSGLDVTHLVTDASDEELRRDRNWEVAAVATQLASLDAFRGARGVVRGSLGFSIGAYAALASAGVVTIKQIVRVIDLVLEGCHELNGRYAMASILGCTDDVLAGAVRPGGAEVSAVLTPGNVLVAGTEDAVGSLCERVAPKALRVARLSVRWPLHTTLMRPVAELLRGRRAEVTGLAEPSHAVFSALHGRVLGSSGEAWELLVDHLWRPQRFDEAFNAAAKEGFDTYVELGPGATLATAVRWMTRGAIHVEGLATDALAVSRATSC